jgi:hypothetical protein
VAYANKEAQKQYAADHYQRNKEVMKERARLFTIEAVKRNQAFVNELKSAPCADCGGIFHPCAMDFDHVRGDKASDVSTMALRAVSLKKLQGRE